MAEFTLSGFAAVDDLDILRFTPSSTGATTAGIWAWHFYGSDVGLSTSDEDVDAFAVLADGRLFISTLGNVPVTGASGADEDLLVFTPTALGATTTGAWAMYFGGSDIFTCTPGSLGSTTTRTWALYWDGSANGFTARSPTRSASSHSTQLHRPRAEGCGLRTAGRV